MTIRRRITRCLPLWLDDIAEVVQPKGKESTPVDDQDKAKRHEKQKKR